MADAFVKPPFYQSAKYLNDVNDAVLGGQIQSVPSGLTASQGQQNIPGDRIILDDATALALSDTAVGTLFGGIYMYVHTLSTATASPAVGSIAFFRAADISGADPYIATSDAQPLTTVPTYVLGVFINAITKGNFGWIQISGVASVLFDSTIVATTAGSMVVAKASAAVASTADNAVTISQATWAAQLGVSIGAAATSVVSKVALLRGYGRL